MLDGDPALPPPKGHSLPPNLRAMSVVAKLGTVVDLGPGHIVLDGDPVPPKKEAQQPPLFGPCLLWPNGRPPQLLLSTCLYLLQFTMTPALQ